MAFCVIGYAGLISEWTAHVIDVQACCTDLQRVFQDDQVGKRAQSYSRISKNESIKVTVL